MPGHDQRNGPKDEEGLPKWADTSATEALDAFLSKGEGPRVEFKERFPTQARDLAKEIAAFASSRGGRVFVGVSDNGTVIGLPECDTPEGRDGMLKRIEGIYKSNVAPPVRPAVSFAASDGVPVLVINVVGCPRPLYYFNGVPYIRVLTESRPATPDEVEEIFRTYHAVGDDDPEDSESSLDLSPLVGFLVEIAAHSSAIQTEARQLNPWLAEFRYRCEAWSESLTDSCATDLMAEDHLREEVKLVARNCDRCAVAIRDLSSGRDNDLSAPIAQLADQARSLKAQLLEGATLSGADRTQLASRAYRISDLAERVRDDDFLFRNTEDVQREAARVGMELLMLLEYPVEFLTQESRDAIEEESNKLLAVETEMLVMDGGRTVERIRKTISDAATLLRRVSLVTEG